MKYLICILLVGCANPPPVKTVELDLCLARKEYKLAASLANGALDPKPGSERAKLEADEDALCAIINP